MPNTLIHIAIQAPISKAISPKTEIPWILAGAIIPDIPWVFQRLLLAANFADPYQIRLYFTAQASLLVSFLLCIALALFSRKPFQIFLILAANCFIHLLLDALQIKWGNGVHLLAPFSWQTFSFGIVWPESIVGYILSATGFGYLCLKLRQINAEGLKLNHTPGFTLATLCIFLYLAAPIAVMKSLESSNSNYIKILKNQHTRIGQHIELDRAYYSKEKSQIFLFSGEPLKISGILPRRSSVISLKGIFTSADAIESKDFHIHNTYRDFASKIGLSFILAIWLYLLIKLKGIFPKYRK